MTTTQVQQSRDAERLARLNINRPQQVNGQSRAEAAYESEKKLRQLAELNVVRRDVCSVSSV